MRAVGSVIYDQDLMKTKGYPASNHGRTRLNGRLRLDQGGGSGDVTGLSGGALWPPVELVRARLRVHRGSAA
jgi:hypothetical protein